MKTNYRFEVTFDHIIRGVPGEEMACPIALAGIESLDANVEVYDQAVIVDGVSYINSWRISTWIKLFDADPESVEPIIVVLKEDDNRNKFAFIEGEES